MDNVEMIGYILIGFLMFACSYLASRQWNKKDDFPAIYSEIKKLINGAKIDEILTHHYGHDTYMTVYYYDTEYTGLKPKLYEAIYKVEKKKKGYLITLLPIDE